MIIAAAAAVAVVAAACEVAGEAVAVLQAPHTIRLGFNVGYLSDGVKYRVARSTLRADGLLLHQRYMGAWMHPNGSASMRTSNWTVSLLSEYLNELGDGASATITLSDFPFNVQPDFIANASSYLDVWAGAPSTRHLADTLRYTNRAPPTRGAWIIPQDEAAVTTALAAYGHEVASLRQLLSSTPSLAGRVDVELGNEPNAIGYFWGDASDWRPIARTARAAMIKGTAASLENRHHRRQLRPMATKRRKNRRPPLRRQSSSIMEPKLLQTAGSWLTAQTFLRDSKDR